MSGWISKTVRTDIRSVRSTVTMNENSPTVIDFVALRDQARLLQHFDLHPRILSVHAPKSKRARWFPSRSSPVYQENVSSESHRRALSTLLLPSPARTCPSRLQLDDVPDTRDRFYRLVVDAGSGVSHFVRIPSTPAEGNENS